MPLSSKILNAMETSSSIGMFARDTGGCLTSKLAVSRSKEEAKEIAFAEISESALFYFSAPAAAKAASKVFSKIYNVDKNIINEPVENIKNIGREKLKDVKLAKFGKIASTFSVILPLVYAIAPVRNLLTYAKDGKDEFSQVVGLKKNDDKEQKQAAKDKAKSLIQTLSKISAVSLAATAGFLALSKSNTVYEKTKPFIHKAVKNLDFAKNGDLKLSHYGALIYPVSIASYFASSRDKYEKRENARRFSVTVPLLFFGEKLIEKPIHKGFDKLFKTKVLENGKIKTYEEIMKLPDKLQKNMLKSKNYSYASTFLINTMAIAAGIGILNRIKTKKDFERDNKYVV